MSTIDHLTQYKYYIDIYTINTISISATKNFSFQLDTDDNNNSLLSSYNAGRLPIISCTTKSTPNGVIFHNASTFMFFDTTFTSASDGNKFLYLPTQQTYYKIKALKETPDTVVGGVLSKNLIGKNIFKVIINGIDIPSTNYTHNDTGVTISGYSLNYITGVNDYIIMYTYLDLQTLDGNSVVVSVLSPDVFHPLEADLISGAAFSGMVELCNFEEYSTTENKSYNEKNKIYEYVFVKEEINRNSKLAITMFEDIRTTIDDDARFRIIGWNDELSKLVVYNNCIFLDGVVKSVRKEKVELTYNIEYEEELIFQY